jgi:hypothetical protein
MNNIKGGATATNATTRIAEQGFGSLITTKSDVTIEFNRYESVFYYETLEMFTSEFINLMSYEQTTPTQFYSTKFFITNDKKCTLNTTDNCTTLINLKDTALKENNDPSTLIRVNGIGGYILERLILNKIYKHSLYTLITDTNNKNNTLIILPYSKNKLSPYLKPKGSEIEKFYNNLFGQTQLHPNVIFINVFPQNSDDDIDTYTNQITEEINKIKKKIIDNARNQTTAISKLMYVVNKDNTIFTDFFQVQLKKKYADVLNNLIDKFYKTDVIERQRINRYNTKIENLSKINKAYIIKELGQKEIPNLKDAIKKLIINEDFKNKVSLLLTILETLYKVRLDASEKKKLSSADNSTLFNIYMRFENLDNPIITNEIIPSQNVLYILKSNKFVDRVGYFSVDNKERNQYKFIINTVEYKKYKDSFKGGWDAYVKEKKSKISEANRMAINEEKEELKLAEELEEEAKINKDINPASIQRKALLLEVRYTFGRIQYRDIQKKLNEPWNSENIATYYKTINPYEKYRFFNHRMIDNSFKDNINIKYYANTLYDKNSLIEFLKSEKKYNEKTRLGYEFININLNNDILVKYNNFIYDKFKNNIDTGISKNVTFEEQIKKNICEILFENSSLVYIRDTSTVTNAPKEDASSDNYKIINYKYTKIENKDPYDKEYISDQIKKYFNTNKKELVKLNCIDCVTNKEITKLPDDLMFQLNNNKKTFALSTVHITKELDMDSAGILFASECKSKKKKIQQGFYNVFRWFRGNTQNNYIGGSKKKKTKKRIKYRHIYSSKYLKGY